MIMDYLLHACINCKERQDVDVVFNAVYPLSKALYTIEYCKHLDLILTDDIKCAVDKIECPFPQKVRDEKRYG